jgi:hypothetical protein
MPAEELQGSISQANLGKLVKAMQFCRNVASKDASSCNFAFADSLVVHFRSNNALWKFQNLKFFK